jgi:hypothetical protein
MKRSDNIIKELEALGAFNLKNLPTDLPYFVPKEYFSNLEFETHQIVTSSFENDPFIPKSIENPLSNVPSGYFENLSDQILNKIKDQEFKNISNPYKIPSNYFDQLPEFILNEAKKDKTKVLPTPDKRVSIFKTIQLAASLAMVIFVGLGIFQKNHSQNLMKKNSIHLTNTEISKYVTENIDDFDTDIVLNGLSNGSFDFDNFNKISNQDIKNYILSEEGN